PPSGAFLAQLAPDQMMQLQQLGVEVVVPGVVPPGFGVARVAMDDGEYAIVYRDDQNRCFGVQFSKDPVDSPAANQQQPVSSPLFPGADYGLNYDPPEDNPSRLFSDWLPGSQGAYRLLGAPDINALQGLSACRNVDLETAIPILESFTTVSPEIMGDGDPP
ncbi:hypothetical protein C7271_15290, partial [filamentous cyanobacterium CCP5]